MSQSHRLGRHLPPPNTGPRFLLAAQGREGDSPHPQNSLEGTSSQPSKPKRQQISNACTNCQKRKTKCDGQRPTCSKCISLKTPCAYDANDQQTRYRKLKRALDVASAENGDFHFLFDLLVRLTPTEGAEIVRRMRVATSAEGGLAELVKQLRDSEVLVPLGKEGREEVNGGVDPDLGNAPGLDLGMMSWEGGDGGEAGDSFDMERWA